MNTKLFTFNIKLLVTTVVLVILLFSIQSCQHEVFPVGVSVTK